MSEGGAPAVGVLALQGAFREHVRALRSLGADAREVRTPGELAGCDALVLPGGESTTIGKLLASAGLDEALQAFDGPILGTCAGMIVLAAEAVDGLPGQLLLGRCRIAVRRNGYGRQVHSFEAPLALAEGGRPFPGVFIRAPRIERVGEGVEVIARLAGEAVAVAQGDVLVTAFHPELTDDPRVHRRFLERVRARRGAHAAA